MDYALEPILKHFNRYLLHYFSTEEIAGPNRLSRAWEGIGTTVGRTALLVRLGCHRADALLDDPLRRRDGGHGSPPDHRPDRLHHARSRPCRARSSRPAPGGKQDGMRRDNSTSRVRVCRGCICTWLDALKIGQRSSCQKYDSQSNRGGKQSSRPGNRLAPRVSARAWRCIFTVGFMDFIQRARELLRGRLGEHINIRSRMDTHRKARARLERLELMNIGEHLYTSALQRYARDFLKAVLDYAAALDDEGCLSV